MPAIDHTTHTIESLIAELTRLAASRGWGAQSLTNISIIKADSGDRGIELLKGYEEDAKALKAEVDGLECDLRSTEYRLESAENERDSLRSAVEKLSAEVLALKSVARQ